ncbi:hypothetical protein Taro_056610 [Colocasia esculenta]|uniref:Uncharacterized protein n=1 Tax=Colocasia esculenta TaxID=4460 RepID=A0A843XWP8_COLES|nr:hypothetical protein [Colocasia esculenta]
MLCRGILLLFLHGQKTGEFGTLGNHQSLEGDQVSEPLLWQAHQIFAITDLDLHKIGQQQQPADGCQIVTGGDI